jgi:hypothetical protein
LTIDNGTNTTQTIDNLKEQFGMDLQTIISTAENEILNATNTSENDIIALAKGDLSDITFPTLPLNLSLDVPPLPQYHLQLELENLDIFVELETVLSGPTFTMNLYTSESEVGLDIDGEELGVVVAVDLILDVDTEVEIKTGFHLKLDDSFVIDIDLLSKNISNIVL